MNRIAVYILALGATAICLVTLWSLNNDSVDTSPQVPYIVHESVSGEPLDTTCEVVINGKILVVELPVDKTDTARGLMYRDSMPEDHGMLFCYEAPSFMSFWMKNTRLPLSIAFIDKNNRIDTILDMEPLDTSRRYFPEHRCMTALEMNQGWFAGNGITVGATVELRLPEGFKRLPNLGY
jgi:uncharacterized protein